MMLPVLPDVSFCETDIAKVEAAVITTYESLAEVTLYPGDPVRLFLESLAALIGQQRVVVNYAAKQNLLYYADGDFLDHIGILTDTERLEAEPALTTLEFSLSGPLGYAVAIPQGTRASAGSELIFETTEPGEIAAGETSASVAAACRTADAAGNGLLPGQINRLVDPIAGISFVVNTTETNGGSDREADGDYRDRIRLSPEKYSSAGPALSYKFWALSAQETIVDVSVLSPIPGQVDLYVLTAGGTPASSDILDLVEAAVNQDKVRPLCDTVTVNAPAQVSYDVTATYYIRTADQLQAASIQSAVQTAVNNYLDWQKAAIGRDINPSELISRIVGAGAKRVEGASPGYTALDPAQVATEGSVSVTYGGLEDG